MQTNNNLVVDNVFIWFTQQNDKRKPFLESPKRNVSYFKSKVSLKVYVLLLSILTLFCIFLDSGFSFLNQNSENQSKRKIFEF